MITFGGFKSGNNIQVITTYEENLSDNYLGLSRYDHINQMISLSVITKCVSIIITHEESLSDNYLGLSQYDHINQMISHY